MYQLKNKMPEIDRIRARLEGENMTRKDYQIIAGAVRDARILSNQGENSQSDNEAIDAVEAYLVQRLGQDSNRFDREKFIQACTL